MARAGKRRVQSLDRGLQILEFVADQDRPVRLAELAGLLGVEKSSAHRLARTLADRRYLDQDSDTLGYELGDALFALAGRLASRRDVRDCGRKYLKILAERTGETAHLAVRGPSGAVLVDHEFGSNPVAVTTGWGSSEPFHCTALGKVLLAAIDHSELLEIVGRGPLKRYTERTITRTADLAEECRRAGEEQVAFDRCEFREDMNCIASPVRDFRGRIVIAIGISGPKERLDGKAIAAMAEEVKNCALELSRELGYSC